MRVRRILVALHTLATTRSRLVLAALLLLAGLLWATDLGRIGATPTIAPEDIGGHIATIEGPRHGLGTEVEKTKLAEVATYIHSRLASFGLTVEEQPVTHEGETFPNIIGILPGTVCPETSFVVGAHYDTVSASPGADDDASGVAGMLEAARVLSSQSFPASIEFVAFSFEEDGLVGSGQMATKASDAGKDLVGMLALDMIGYFSDEPGSQTYPDGFPSGYPDTGNFIAVISNTASHPLLNTFMAASASAVPGLATESIELSGNGGSGPGLWGSDHTGFWNAGYQALLITDTAGFRNPNYHLPSDTLSTLDLAFAADVANAVVAAVVESVEDPASACPGIPTFTPTITPTPTQTLTPTITPTKQPTGDTDGDGCTDAQENGAEETLGGRRSFLNFWDFYDVWTRPVGNPSGWKRNKAIDLFGDIFGVAFRFGANDDDGSAPVNRNSDPLVPPASDNKSGYHPAFDGGALVGPNPWNVGPADGSIDLFNDILGVANQFGHDCTAAP